MLRARGGGIGGKWGVSADVYGISFWGDENVLNLDLGDDCTILKT